MYINHIKLIGSNANIIPAVALAIFAATAQSTTAAIAKYLVRDYPVTQILCARNAVLVSLVLISVRFCDWSRLLDINQPILQISRAIFPLLASFLMFLALKYIPLADATAIIFAAPLFIILLSIWALGEKVGAMLWAAVLIGFVGVSIVLRPGTDAAHWAAGLLLIAAAFIALYQVITKIMTASVSPSSTLLVTGAVGTVCTAVFMPFFWIEPDLLGWSMLVASGVTFALGHYCWFKALSLAPASVLAPLIYTQIVAAILLGVVLFQEIPEFQTVFGMAIIMASGFLIFLNRQPTQ